ncbi:MAG: glycosyltransferase family 2 protein [Ignavibacteria bacterium]|nr:glycosyltransferase family 2 protein [Ignavibacteria bacterium]
MDTPLSTLILTYNSSHTLDKCLKSVSWTDEIVIIDSYSTDSTLEIARKYNCKIYQIERKRWPELISFALPKISNDWILFIDSDEELSKELQEEIKEIFKTGNINNGGYEIERQVYFIGKWINYGEWNRDFQYRLLNKNYVEISNLEIHGTFLPKSNTTKLKNKIYHYTYRNIFDFVERINWYSTLDITVKLEKNPDKKVKWYNLIFNPLCDFLKVYISKKGFKDGIHGFILAVFSSMHKFCTYAKLWEYIYCKKNNLELPPKNYKDLVNLIRKN